MEMNAQEGLEQRSISDLLLGITRKKKRQFKKPVSPEIFSTGNSLGFKQY